MTEIHFDVCELCGDFVTEQKHYWSKHKTSIADYFLKFRPRLDLQTNEPIVFKSPEQYLNDDFNNKNNLKAYLGSLTDEAAYSYIVNLFKKRKELKKLIYLPGQFELRSILIPPISYILKRFPNKLDDLVKETGLENRYNYDKTLLFLDKKLDIIIDSREQNVVRFDCNKVKTEIRKLNVGDYCPRDNPYNIYVERKSVNDWAGTLSVKGYDRFCKELDRSVDSKSYLIIVIEGKFSDLTGYNMIPHYRHIKAHPNYIMQKARALSIQYAENCQFVAANGRIGCKNLVEKIFGLDEKINPRKVDWQMVVDTKQVII